ncbi:MAG TPA: YicC family protein [Spirochaetaceae bacterium]|nr:YicC family protein [Spirochaetaceae bacterium]
MKSMTGYGAARLDSPLIKAQLTMKALNNRYLELTLNLPSLLSAYERRIRDTIESRIRRGKVDFSIKILGGELPTEVHVDAGAARAISAALRDLAAAAGIDEPIKLSHLLGIEGILSFHRSVDADGLWESLVPAVNACIDAFEAERLKEGASARADLERQLGAIEASVLDIAARADELDAQIRVELRRRFEEVLGDLVDETRILTELASYLAKHTINEELVRLKAHIASFRATLDEEQCGKKLDFICQELNRETNTIGSKSAQVEVSAAVIRMKDAIENIREQVRNVE